MRGGNWCLLVLCVILGAAAIDGHKKSQLWEARFERLFEEHQNTLVDLGTCWDHMPDEVYQGLTWETMEH